MLLNFREDLEEERSALRLDIEFLQVNCFTLLFLNGFHIFFVVCHPFLHAYSAHSYIMFYFISPICVGSLPATFICHTKL